MNWEAISSVATAIGTLVALAGVAVQAWSAATARKRRAHLIAWELGPLVIMKKLSLLKLVDEIVALLAEDDAVVRSSFHEIQELARRQNLTLEKFDRGELAELPGKLAPSLLESEKLTQVLLQRIAMPSIEVSHRHALELSLQTAKLLLVIDWRICDQVELLMQDLWAFDRYVQMNFRDREMDRALARVRAGELTFFEAGSQAPGYRKTNGSH